MTDPAMTALADQLGAANQMAANVVTESGGETWPDVGPVSATAVALMLQETGARHQRGQPVACPHLAQAVDLAIWFPWAASHWLCATCADTLVAALFDTERTPCNGCGTSLQVTTAHLLDIHVPGELQPPGEGAPRTAARMAPPTLAKLLLCADCSDRNKTSDDTSTSLN